MIRVHGRDTAEDENREVPSPTKDEGQLEPGSSRQQSTLAGNTPPEQQTPQPPQRTNATIKVFQPVIVIHLSAKRLLHAVTVALQCHKQAFRVLKTNVRKQIQPG